MSAPDGNLYPGDANRLLRAVAARCEKSFFELEVDWLGYPRQTLARRYTQKLLAEITVPFRREVKRRAVAGEAWNAVLEGTRLDCGDLQVNPQTGATAMRTVALAKWIGIFLAYWFYILFQTCLALRFRREPAIPAATLLHGVGHESLARLGNDSSFLDFVRTGPIDVLREAQMLFVQAVRPVAATQPDWTRYARYPLLALLRRRGFTPSELASFLAGHLRCAGAFLRAILKVRTASLLARDFAFDAAAAHANRSGMLAAVVLTGSNFLEQMLWMSDLPGRRYRSHMIFYSVNGSHPFVYKAHPIYEHQPSLSYIRLDEHWVWTRAQAEAVREWGSEAKCNIVGPVLFYQPAQTACARRGQLQLVVFDITPLEPDYIERLAVINPYYTTANVMKFIRDVLEVRELCARALGRPIALVVKPKRKYQRVHSSEYIDYLLAGAAEDPDFRILDPDTDLTEVIRSSDCVITMPYSSPPYVAVGLGVPSLYYDPSDTLVASHEPHPLIAFAGNPVALKRALDDALSGAAQRAAQQAAAS